MSTVDCEKRRDIATDIRHRTVSFGNKVEFKKAVNLDCLPGKKS